MYTVARTSHTGQHFNLLFAPGHLVLSSSVQKQIVLLGIANYGVLAHISSLLMIFMRYTEVLFLLPMLLPRLLLLLTRPDGDGDADFFGGRDYFQ